jgi:hypothetical protein
LAVMLPEALTENVQLTAAAPPLLHIPDQIAPCPLSVVSVTCAPVAKLADPELPLETLKPAGLDVTLPPLPVTVRVTVALELLHGEPQVKVPPQPSAVVPHVLPCAAQVVGVHTGDAVTFKGALTVVFRVAEIVAATLACTAEVPAVKLAEVAPEDTVIDAGTLTKLLLLARLTTAPVDGAGGLTVTVPIDEFPPVTVPGFIVRDVTESV